MKLRGQSLFDSPTTPNTFSNRTRLDSSILRDRSRKITNNYQFSKSVPSKILHPTNISHSSNYSKIKDF